LIPISSDFRNVASPHPKSTSQEVLFSFQFTKELDDAAEKTDTNSPILRAKVRGDAGALLFFCF